MTGQFGTDTFHMTAEEFLAVPVVDEPAEYEVRDVAVFNGCLWGVYADRSGSMSRVLLFDTA